MTEKPPLPPRNPSTQSSSEIRLYTSSTEASVKQPPRSLSPNVLPSTGSTYPSRLYDPRSSSTQSLRPVESAGDDRRTLLVVYIHGFLGDETSFQGFPAHVHGLLTQALASTHVVYTKIYPRYKSRKTISLARDNFSKWLAPHESDTTDVILAGHSLGGILGAEVVLMPPQTPQSNRPFQHRILGLIAFDTPFLGMHPGVVGTGIASLFRAPPELAESPLASLSPFSDPASASLDHTYNPSYPNDIRLSNRQGKLQRAWYFWNKHAGELTKAASDYVSSHLEFGGCLADYSGLRKRYNAVRALEDVNELMKPLDPDGHLMKRVRFVNYYSASTGPVKERPLSSPKQHTILGADAAELQASTSTPSSGQLTPERLPMPSDSSPRISLEEHRDVDSITGSTAETDTNPKSSADLVEHALSTLTLTSSEAEHSLSGYEGSIVEVEMPPLPDLPARPSDFDPSLYHDEDSLKLFQKAHERDVKAYERAVKDRERSLKEREKYVQKRQREAAKQREKAERETLKQQARLEKEISDLPPASSPAEVESAQQGSEAGQNKEKAGTKQKDRKFCVLPKDPHTKQTDSRWIRVYMEGIDEVVAHTSLFKMGETYVKMVGDMVERVEKWTQEDHSTRMILAELNGETWEDLD